MSENFRHNIENSNLSACIFFVKQSFRIIFEFSKTIILFKKHNSIQHKITERYSKSCQHLSMNSINFKNKPRIKIMRVNFDFCLKNTKKKEQISDIKRIVCNYQTCNAVKNRIMCCAQFENVHFG